MKNQFQSTGDAMVALMETLRAASEAAKSLSQLTSDAAQGIAEFWQSLLNETSAEPNTLSEDSDDDENEEPRN